MEKKKKLSGYENRKRKAESNEKKAKMKKIETFFISNIAKHQRTAQITQLDTDIAESETNSSSSASVTSKPMEEVFVEISAQIAIGTSSSDSAMNSRAVEIYDRIISKDSLSSDSDNFLLKILKHEYPTDRGHYPQNISQTTIKKFILNYGPCRPNGPFPPDDSGRSFSINYYESISKSGMKVSRYWLCFSMSLKCCYCEPCWLFSNRKHPAFKDNWIKGISNWKKLSEKILKHEKSNVHHEACVIYDKIKRDGFLDEQMSMKNKQESSYWRKILHRIINVTRTLAIQNLAFRGREEHIREGKAEGGNFLAIITLLAEYDPVLKDLLDRPAGVVKYLSPKIQNEIIQILGEHIEANIFKNVKESGFYSLIVDSTQDITKIDQLSIVFRYVKILYDENNIPSDVEVKEAFAGFHVAKDKTAAGLEDFILRKLETKGVEIQKLRGQGYDGASVMSGIYNGLQARLQRIVPNAPFVHCAAHNLNLVINDCVKGVPEAVDFFDTVQHIYVFLSSSVKRWEILLDCPVSTLTLKKLNPVRWSSRNDSLVAIRYNYKELIRTFTEIQLKSKSNEERSEARGLLNKIQKFEFIFLIVLFEKLLTSLNLVSKMLQMENCDVLEAETLLNTAYNNIKTMRGGFLETKNIASGLAASWGTETRFTSKRQRKVKKHFDELCEDARFCDTERKFQITTYNTILDITLFQLKQRLEGFQNTINLFKVLNPKYLAHAKDDELFSDSLILKDKYESDLTDLFPMQLLALRAALKEEIGKCCNIKDLAKLIICKNHTIVSSFPDVVSAVTIFLTLPVTTANAERSFSKLKLIKNYLRSTMSQTRLHGLALLSIESDTSKTLDLEHIITTFAETKARRVNI